MFAQRIRNREQHQTTTVNLKFYMQLVSPLTDNKNPQISANNAQARISATIQLVNLAKVSVTKTKKTKNKKSAYENPPVLFSAVYSGNITWSLRCVLLDRLLCIFYD